MAPPAPGRAASQRYKSRGDGAAGGKVGRVNSSRKNRRKLARAGKKQRKLQHQSTTVSGEVQHQSRTVSGKLQAVKEGRKVRSTGDKGGSVPTRGEKTGGASSLSALSIANERDKEDIAKLEKLLKIDKKNKKKKSFPNTFREDGLDYLLELTDKESAEWELSDAEDIDLGQSDSESGPEEVGMAPGARKQRIPSATSVVMGGAKVEVGVAKIKRRDESKTSKTVSFRLKADEGEGEGEGDSDGTAEEEEMELEESETGSIASEEEGEASVGDGSDGCLEGNDDGDGGDVATERPADLAVVYVPPHLRTVGKCERLRKRLQGLMNRLTESNMKSVSGAIEQLYLENSRNDMNAALWEVIEKACVGPVLMSERFSMEQALLVAILHHHVGTEVGAHVVQRLVVRLDAVLSVQTKAGEQRGKEAECLILLLAQLYNYRVIHCLLIYDIIRRLVASFTERDVELLLLLLKNSGMEIRKDDSKSLKDIITQIQSKAADSALFKTSRVKFMLETISALRTNNTRKIPNHDPTLLEHMKRVLRGLLRLAGSLDEAQLKVSLEDLLQADKQGRWWVVGSAWTGRDTNASRPEGVAMGMGVGSESWVMELARKQRMNTDVRKTVFTVIMTSEDYVDGFQKLVRLGLKDVQEREVVHVLVDCCLQEKHFNPYYAYLAQKLCEFKKANQVTFQYSLWDRFKSLDSLTPSNLTNLSHLCLHLITKKALSLAILKVVEFAELDNASVQFYGRLLRSLLTVPSRGVVLEVFSRVVPLPHLKKLRDSLLIFIKHYVADTGEGQEEEGPGGMLSQRIKMVEHAFRAPSQLF